MTDPIASYLIREFRAAAWMYAAGALFSALLGFVILTIAFYAMYFAFWFLASFWTDKGTLIGLISSAVAILSLFVFGWRSTQKLFENYSSEPTLSGSFLSLGLFSIGIGRGGMMPLSPGTSRNLVRVAADLLLSGPRLLASSLRLCKLVQSLRRVDPGGCARVLACLLKMESRLSLREIREAERDLDHEAIFEQLHQVEGVIFLKRDSPSLTLTDSFRKKLHLLMDSQDRP